MTQAQNGIALGRRVQRRPKYCARYVLGRRHQPLGRSRCPISRRSRNTSKGGWAHDVIEMGRVSGVP